MASAPDGSTTSRDRSAASRTPAAISASLTVTIPSRCARRWAKVRAPSAWVRVPSAIVRATSAADQRTISPRCQRIAGIGRELGLDADDPNVRAQALIAVATPLASPPPPTGTSTRPVVGRSSDDLEPDRALAGDDPVVVERRDDRQTALRGDRLRACLALVGRGPDDDDLGAVGRHALALDRRRVVRHDDHCRSCPAGGPRGRRPGRGCPTSR